MSDFNRTQWPTEDVIGPFDGEYSYLSNFNEAEFEYKGTLFSTSEHAYQAMKAVDNEDLYNQIASASSPKEAKRHGKKPSLPDDWNEEKKFIMLEIVTAKFSQNPGIREKLVGTENQLIVELNKWGDTYWGAKESGGEGKNMLGRILMEVRSSFQSIQ